MLAQHPDVYLPPCKDIYYFDRYYHRGAEWYEAHFDGARFQRAIGEVSHDYLQSETACFRIEADLPDVKLITVLRNPIERAYSEYLYIRKHRLVDDSTSVREAAVQFPTIINGGMYGHHLERYLHKFHRNRLFIGDYTDVALRPVDILAELCAFLEIDPSFPFKSTGRVVLPASSARNAWIARSTKMFAVKLRDCGFEELIGVLKQSRLLQKALYKKYLPSEKPTIAVADREWLQNVYAEDVKRLERLLQRSFGKWLDPRSTSGSGGK